MTAFTTYVSLYVCMEETEREKKSVPKTCSCLQHQGLYLCRRLKSVKCVGNIDPLANVVRYSRELHESMLVTYVCIYVVVYLAVCMYLCMYIVESRDGLHDTCASRREFTY